MLEGGGWRERGQGQGAGWAQGRWRAAAPNQKRHAGGLGPLSQQLLQCAFQSCQYDCVLTALICSTDGLPTLSASLGCETRITSEHGDNPPRVCAKCHNPAVQKAKSRTWFSAFCVPLFPFTSTVRCLHVSLRVGRKGGRMMGLRRRGKLLLRVLGLVTLG